MNDEEFMEYLNSDLSFCKKEIKNIDDTGEFGCMCSFYKRRIRFLTEVLRRVKGD